MGLADMMKTKAMRPMGDMAGSADAAPDEGSAETAAPDEGASDQGDPIAEASDQIAQMAQGGEMTGTPLEGPEITFDTTTFDKLADDKEGDTVVAVICGQVTAAADGSVTVKVKDAAVVHGSKSMAPGGGGRFAALKGELAHRPGVNNPGGLAAAIGRKKYGEPQMAKWSAEGRKRSAS